MKEQNNFYKITGIIYEKPIRTAQGKVGTKTEGQTFEFPSIILEVKREYKDKTYSELPEFELGRNVNTEEFMIGDNVDVYFSLSGKRISNSWHKTVAKATYLKHADVYDTREVGGKTPSDFAKKETVFVPPSPEDEEYTGDLPF